MSTFKPLSDIYLETYRSQEFDAKQKINEAKHIINMYNKSGNERLKRTAIEARKEAEESIKDVKKIKKIAEKSISELEKFRRESLEKLMKNKEKVRQETEKYETERRSLGFSPDLRSRDIHPLLIMPKHTYVKDKSTVKKTKKSSRKSTRSKRTRK